ncbi:MAG TPA: signal peptidase I [Sedimenticola sp.]|nr:signal peptidase I [Sedimenticola sp.]
MDLNFPAILVLAVFITGGIWLIDAVMFAPRRRALAAQEAENGVCQEDIMRHTREPVLVEYARSFFPVILIVLLLRSFLVEPFRIPSSSMMPTLLVGDFILVNKFAYGIRLPVLNKKIIEIGEPKRGDVVVFRYPLNPSIDYIKRVVGIPGDQISYRNKVLYINGRPMPQTPIGRYTGIGTGASETGSLYSMETLDGVEHAILVRAAVPDFAPGCQVLLRGPVTVPEGKYFAMGDNRDNSNDSRCWGFVPEENLVGKAFGIWMSWDTKRPGFPVAWERLGEGID